MGGHLQVSQRVPSFTATFYHAIALLQDTRKNVILVANFTIRSFSRSTAFKASADKAQRSAFTDFILFGFIVADTAPLAQDDLKHGACDHHAARKYLQC